MTHIISGCSPMNTTSVNDSPNPKHPNVTPQRRQSQRISAINAIYKMAEIMSSEIQQTSAENSPCGSKEIKFESLETLDDPSIAETLMDMRKRCKAKKRKSVDSFGSSNADLDEPLICLKSKKSNKSSASRKRRKCLLFDELSQVEEISGSSPMEPDRSSFLKEVTSGAESVSTAESVNDDMEVENNLGGSSIELSQRVCEGELANGESYSSTEKFLHPCVINHSSSPPMNDVPTSHVDFIAKFSSAELHQRNDGSESRTEDFTIFTADHLDCRVNEISVEFTETESCEDHFGDKINIGCSETTELMSDVFGSARNFDHIRNHLQNLEPSQECTLLDTNMEPRMTKEFDNQEELSFHSRDFHDSCHASGFSEEVGSLDSLVLKALSGDPCSLQHSNMTTNSSCNLRDSNEISPEKVSLRCSRVVDQMLNDHVEKNSEIDRAEFVNSDIEKSRFEKTCELSIPAVEKNVEGEESNMKNEVKSDQGIEYHPKKLLTSRKDLSPISQEKLRRALSSSELDDSMKTANNDEAEMMMSPEKMRKKSKSRVSRGVLRSPNTPDRNCPCAKNSSIHTQAQKAVTFMQRQMQDIETIATKLLKGLASMKNIVVENVGSEECLSTLSKISPEEVNIAVENASNLEATTKKWLSMMAKDCNRFCKIMQPTENKEATPLSVMKQPKKITFADEAGGSLCHVKVFDQVGSE